MLDLKSFLKQHPEMLKSKNALYSGLIEIYPNEKLAVRLVLVVYESGILNRLSQAQQLDAATVGPLMRRLMDDYGLTEQYALEGITYWAACFDKQVTYTIQPAQPAPQQQQPAPAPQPQPKPAPQQQPQPIVSSNNYYSILAIGSDSVRIEEYHGPGGSVTIPSMISGKRVTEIGKSAFEKFNNVTTIVIPDGVTSIGDWAFERCESLQSVTIPEGVTSIGEDAFYRCYNLQSITIPNSVTSIGDSAFAFCESLQSITIPNSVTSIGESAFSDCKSLRSVTIPNSVTSIGIKAFQRCYNLQSVTIPEGVTSIGKDAFYRCYYLQSITIPNSVTSIGDEAFCECTSLQTITIPNSVTSIGKHAFNLCSSLQSVTIPNSVTSIGDWAFERCESLQSVTLPNSVTYIGRDAFLRDFLFHKKTTIRCYAGSYALRYAMENNLPVQDASQPLHAPKPTPAPQQQPQPIVSDNKEYSIAAVGPDSVRIVNYHGSGGNVTIPSVISGKRVTEIGKSAFEKFNNVTTIVIPDGVTSIGERAFEYCKSLQSVTIPNSVTSIADSAFDVYCYPTIRCSRGSYAAHYAAKHGLPVKYVSATTNHGKKWFDWLKG